MSETKNELEILLEKAATEPAHRPAFFRTLLESTVWVPGSAAEGEAIVEDSALDLQHWEKEDGTTVIPFFTSLEALQQAVEDEQAFVVMPARTLFEMTLGETLFLNAKLPTGKEFMPREISLLLAEEGSPLSTQEVLEGGESLILSEVAEPPSQMIDSLTTLFKTIKPVKRAFLCAIKEHADAQPNLLIGIEADGEIEEIIHAAGNVATDTLPGDEPIDICQVRKGEQGISHFITEHIAPFYERRWGGFLRDFKQNRIIRRKESRPTGRPPGLPALDVERYGNRATWVASVCVKTQRARNKKHDTKVSYLHVAVLAKTASRQHRWR